MSTDNKDKEYINEINYGTDANKLKDKINKLIEETIEQKINKILEILPLEKEDVYTPKYIYDYTIIELYNGTIQTVINIINELSLLFSDRKYLSSKEYRIKLFSILFQDDRKIFVGIILIMLSFVLYFIDGANA